jgi:cation transport ATPase
MCRWQWVTDLNRSWRELVGFDSCYPHSASSTVLTVAADFVLLNSDLSTLLPLLGISRKVTTRQVLNLGWAIVFNVVCLPFAAGVFYPAGGIRLTPVWAAVLMALSSVSVVCSSLALRWGL